MANISVRLNEQEEIQFNERVRQSNLTKSDYVKTVISGNTINVVDQSKEIYQGLNRINEIISQMEATHKGKGLDSIRREVSGICHMLNL